MENKKILIPIILGSALLLGIIFTLVYKKTSEDPFKESVEQTLAPKESETTIETKVQGDNSNSLEEFDINKIKPNETKVVYVDESGNILSEEDAKEIEESEIESISQMVEQASIDAQSVNEEDYIVDESKEAESFSQDEFSDFQSGVSLKISELTAQDAIRDLRIVLKSEVEKYAPEYPELQGITSEMIDNYSEDELYDLYNRISIISRGY